MTEHHECTVEDKYHQEESPEHSVDVKGNSNPDYTLDVECSQWDKNTYRDVKNHNKINQNTQLIAENYCRERVTNYENYINTKTQKHLWRDVTKHRHKKTPDKKNYKEMWATTRVQIMT